MNRVQILEKIVQESQAMKVNVIDTGKSRKVLVDASSANVALRVIKLVNDTNRAKLLAMPLPKMINVCWAVTAKAAA